MKCYKCYAEEDLSLKARFRDGRPRLFICRPCRRIQWKAQYYGIKEQPTLQNNNQRIMDKYA